VRVRPSTFALADLDRVVYAQTPEGRASLGGRPHPTEAWLLWDEDLGWGWWVRIDGTEDVAAYGTWKRPTGGR
jgi:hypothetical protein